jgi:hypothetical protein
MLQPTTVMKIPMISFTADCRQLLKSSREELNINIVMGDLNAKVGCDNTGFEEVMGRQGTTTERGSQTYVP